jgi:hypothetical protein
MAQVVCGRSRIDFRFPSSQCLIGSTLPCGSEQIVAGTRAATETGKAAKSTLVARVKKIRWCFWHANVQKAESRMREILLICRIVVPKTLRFGESLAQT